MFSKFKEISRERGLPAALLSVRYRSIPGVICVLFVTMIVMCHRYAPQQYQDKHLFHISNLGNWQEGLGFFSFFMSLIAFSMLVFFSEIYRYRAAEERHRYRGQSHYPCVFDWHLEMQLAGAVIAVVGLLMTGSFQQSYNKPFHSVGFAAIVVGFIFVAIWDIFHYFHLKSTQEILLLWPRLAFVYRLVVFLIILVAGISFAVLNQTAKKEWSVGEAAALEVLNLTDCPPKWTPDYYLSGKDVRYPNYYPCKSRTLWDEGDPGWAEFQASSVCEILLFCLMCCYLLSYSFFELPCRPWQKRGPDTGHEGNADHMPMLDREKV